MTSSAAFRDLSDVRIVATIEARMTSSRLPGKVVAPIEGRPMLAMMIERLKGSQLLSGVCVATTTNREDEPLVKLAAEMGISCFRGSEEDVLARVVGAARQQEADVIVELTGDCPMVDPSIVDACIFAYFAEDTDYCANHLVPSFPRGLDVQVFATDVLEEVERITQDPADREHVSLYIYEHPDRYAIRNVQAPGPLRRPGWRWTVDTPEDLEFVRQVVARLGWDFRSIDVVRLLAAEPELLAINGHVEQKKVR